MVIEIKRGQVTLFIILALVIIVGILAAVFFMTRTTEINAPAEENPVNFVQDCVQEKVEDAVFSVMDGGGRTEPSQYIPYKDYDYNYLCYTADYYTTCYNTHPMLELIAETEIREATKDEVQECFNSMRTELESKGYSVSGSSTSYSIDLLPGSVDIKLEKPITVSRDGTSQSYEDFSFGVMSPLYNMIWLARLIVNDESQYCNFEYNGFMILYPEFDIRRIDYDESRLYRVIDRNTGYEFKFAVRSCAFAPGI